MPMWKFLRRGNDDDELEDDDDDGEELTSDDMLGFLADPETRLDALEELAHDDTIRGPNIEILRKVLELGADSDPEVRSAVMDVVTLALSDVETIRVELQSHLVQGMTDDSAELREVVQGSLGHLTSDDVEALRDELDDEKIKMQLAAGEVSEEVIAALEELGANELLRALRSDDEDLMKLSAEARGFEALAELPTDERWAWEAAAAIAQLVEPFPLDEDPKECWTAYEKLLVPALATEETRAEAIEGLRALARTTDLGPLLVSNDEALEALLVLAIGEDVEVRELLAELCPSQFVDAVWDEIEEWLALNAPKLKTTLPVGASPEKLSALQELLGIELSRSLSASLARHDGCALVHAGDSDVSVANIIEEIHRRKEGVGVPFEETEEHGPSVPAVLWHASWVPIWTRGDGDIQVLDMDSGRVLYLGHDGPLFRAERAHSYAGWLFQYLVDLREGHYRASEDGLDTDLPVWPRDEE